MNSIGRLLVIDFEWHEEAIFEKIIEVLREYPEIEKYELPHEKNLN